MILLLILATAAAPLPRVHRPGDGVDIAAYEKVPPPKIEMRTSMASATTVPWIDANGWRFMRGVAKALYPDLPPGQAALAAAEAYTYGVDALLEPADTDSEALSSMLKFLQSIDAPRMPVRANIGIIDDGSEEIAEVLNLLGRRNLLYKVVKTPDPKLELNIRIGSKEYPRDSVQDPNDFAARVRERITDDRRLIRLFNTYTVLAHLTGDGSRARLHLLNYSRRPANDVRVRVLGEYSRVRLAEAADPKQQAVDVAVANGATEFTVPQITTYAVVDLDMKR